MSKAAHTSIRHGTAQNQTAQDQEKVLEVLMPNDVATPKDAAQADDLEVLEVLMPKRILEELKWLSDFMDVTPTQALRQAIATQAYIEKAQRRGGEILVRRDGEVHKVIFTPEQD